MLIVAGCRTPGGKAGRLVVTLKFNTDVLLARDGRRTHLVTAASTPTTWPVRTSWRSVIIQDTRWDELPLEIKFHSETDPPVTSEDRHCYRYYAAKYWTGSRVITTMNVHAFCTNTLLKEYCYLEVGRCRNGDRINAIKGSKWKINFKLTAVEGELQHCQNWAVEGVWILQIWEFRSLTPSQIWGIHALTIQNACGNGLLIYSIYAN